MYMKYPGWELEFFDKAINYRKYQYSLIKSFIQDSILEVGPGNAVLMYKFIYRSDLDIALAEVDKNLCENIKNLFKSKEKVTIFNSNIDSIDKSFKTIMYLDVIEHIENYQEEILKAYNKLELDGHLIIMVPSYQHLYSYYDAEIGHYRRFNKDFFKGFAKRNNIFIEKMVYFDCIGYFFLLINKIFKLRKRKNVDYGTKVWNFLVPVSKTFDKILFHSFGKSLMCVYKKK